MKPPYQQKPGRILYIYTRSLTTRELPSQERHPSMYWRRLMHRLCREATLTILLLTTALCLMVDIQPAQACNANWELGLVWPSDSTQTPTNTDIWLMLDNSNVSIELMGPDGPVPHDIYSYDLTERIGDFIIIKPEQDLEEDQDYYVLLTWMSTGNEYYRMPFHTTTHVAPIQPTAQGPLHRTLARHPRFTPGNCDPHPVGGYDNTYRYSWPLSNIESPILYSITYKFPEDESRKFTRFTRHDPHQEHLLRLQYETEFTDIPCITITAHTPWRQTLSSESSCQVDACLELRERDDFRDIGSPQNSIWEQASPLQCGSVQSDEPIPFEEEPAENPAEESVFPNPSDDEPSCTTQGSFSPTSTHSLAGLLLLMAGILGLKKRTNKS